MATIHLTQIINNDKVEFHLCDSCAKEKNYMNFTVVPDVSSFFNSLLGFTGQPHVNTAKAVTCKVCGMSFEDFKETGKMGCFNCYKTFQDRIDPIVKRIHGNAEHAGRVPKNHTSKTYKSTDAEQPSEAELLKKQLEELIKQEKFEEAARVRDKIKALENVKKEG
jgi:Uncharacterized protein with conserved CXXC pairs